MYPYTLLHQIWGKRPTLCKPNGPDSRWLLLLIGLGTLVIIFFSVDLIAAIRLPGSDVSDKLTAAGTLLRIIDTGLFKWGARIFAGLCLMSGGWALKEQKYGIFIICIIGAIIFGTIAIWVRNIFEIGGNSTIFSYLNPDTIYFYLKAA